MTPLPASRRNLTLFLLGLVATINYIDRQAFTVLMEDIKRDLVLSDTVLGLISGLVFGVIYALSSLPIARYADRGDRPLVIATCLGFWSLATAACGLAANAWQIALARIGVAVGESGSAPPSMSLLTEIFPENRRTLVVGVMQSANSIGLSLGVVLAAWLATLIPDGDEQRSVGGGLRRHHGESQCGPPGGGASRRCHLLRLSPW